MSGLLTGKRKRVVGHASIGCNPKRLKEEVQTMVFHIHDFADLTQERGKSLVSPSIRAFGQEWNFKVYPRGSMGSSETIECISCYIQHVGDGTVFAKCSFRCKDFCQTFQQLQSFTLTGHGFTDFLKRKNVVENYLNEDGTLVIEIDMQIAVDKENNNNVWYPKLNIPNDMLTELYHSSSKDNTNTADAVFDVDGKEFYGHKNILSLRSRTIAELMKDNNTNNDGVAVVPIPIPNMESSIFEGVLKFVYCVERPTIEDNNTATKFLLAANCLGVVDLKMFVESTIVEKFLNSSNAANWLVFSDSHSCPLLKEASMKLYDNDADVVMESKGWSQIEESPRLLLEILKFCKVTQQLSAANSNNQNGINDVITLDVTSLRERLLEANLDLDGNQEILIERLKDHISSSQSSESTRNNDVSSSPAVAAVAAAAVNPPPQRRLRRRRQPRDSLLLYRL